MKSSFVGILSLLVVLVMGGCAIQPQNDEEQEALRLNVNEGEWNNLSPSEKAAAIGSYD